MPKRKESSLSVESEYNGALTREQFLFYEMRTTAKLLVEGKNNKEVIDEIIKDNLFQYPTEKSIKLIANGCIKRLQALNDNELIKAIAEQPSDVAKQVCLYAMMKRNRLVWEFMISVIGQKYASRDLTLKRSDLNAFFMQLQEQDDNVATWSESTIKKIISVLIKVLVENEYLDNNRSEKLNPVWLNSILENGIRNNGDQVALPAFNCFS